MKIKTLFITACLALLLAACGVGIEVGPEPPVPPTVSAPSLTDVSAALISGHPYCMNPGEAWSVVLPECNWSADAAAADRRYTLVGVPALPAWLAFDEATRTVGLSGVTVVPVYSDAITVTYTCFWNPDPTITASISFVINDCDHPGTDTADRGIIDYLETLSSEPPRIVNNIGYVLLNDFNVDAYMPLYPAGTSRKVDWALPNITDGLDPTDPLDDTGDIDGDGITNLLEVTNDTNLFVRFSAPIFARSVANNSSFNYGIAYADFNNDGFLDMTVGLFNGSVGVHLWNDAIGDFDGEANSVIIAGGFPLIDIAAADFNSDGNQDAAIVEDFSGDLHIAYGDGAGKLILHQTINLADSRALSLADFNADGFVDIALINEFQVWIYLYNPGTDLFALLNLYNSGGFPRDVVVADFNGDNIVDCASIDDFANQVYVYLGNGDGTFALSNTYNIGNNPRNLTAADFNNDGFIDLAVSEDVDFIAIFTGNGDGTLNDVSHIALSTDTGFLTAGDFNGDNAIDLAMTDFADKRFIIGLNTFKTTGTIAFTEILFGTGAVCNSIAVFDIGNDNLLDVAVTDPAILASVVQLLIQ